MELARNQIGRTGGAVHHGKNRPRRRRQDPANRSKVRGGTFAGRTKTGAARQPELTGFSLSGVVKAALLALENGTSGTAGCSSRLLILED
jgi:hypothetical protein